MADIFGRTDQILRGGLSSDAMFMTWPALAATGGGLGMLIQSVGIDYSQNIRRIFELGPGVIPSTTGWVSAQDCDSGALSGITGAALCLLRTQPTYFIISRPEGTFSAQRFVGPEVLGQCFYRTYGSACCPNCITITGKAGCNASDNVPIMSWVINGLVVNRYRSDITAQESVIQEGFSAMFAGLNLLVNGVDLPCTARHCGTGVQPPINVTTPHTLVSGGIAF